jgi:hypothetical protein
VRQREALAQMRFHSGDAYRFAVVGGRYTATAKFGRRELLDADDPEQLLTKGRRHYRRDPLEERSST